MGSGSNELYLLLPGNYFLDACWILLMLNCIATNIAARLTGGFSVVVADPQAVTTDSKRQGLV